MAEEEFEEVMDRDISLLSDVISSQLGDIDNSFESLQRMMDTHNTIRSYITKHDPSETSFESGLSHLLQCAYAGTELEVVGEVSFESAMDALKAMGRAIIELIRRIITGIIDAIANFDLMATWLSRNIKLLERKRLTSRGKTPSENYVVLSTTHRFLRTGRVFADEPVKLHNELKTLLQVLKVCSNELPSGLNKGVSAISTRAGTKLGQELKDSLLESVHDVGFDRIATNLKMSPIGNERFGRSQVKSTSPLLGGKSLFYLEGDLGGKGLTALRNHGIIYADTFRVPFKVESEREFKSLSPSDLTGIPEILLDIVMTISKSGSGGVTTSLRNVRDNLERYVQRRMGESDISETDMSSLRTISNAYTAWSKNVIPPLYGTSMSIVRAVLHYAQLSVKTYK